MLNPRTRAVSLGGLLAALAIVFLVFSALSPTADLSLLALSSLPVAIAVIELGNRRAALVYLAVSLISLAYPGLAFSYLFILFFGVFPLIKAALETKYARPLALLGKQLAANILLMLAAWLFARDVIQVQSEQFGAWFLPGIFVLLQVVIVVYDYALTLLISFYFDRLARHLRRF